MAEKKKIMLITPMLHQGGFERICVMTARLLQEKGYQVTIVVFSMEDAFYDVSGLTVEDLHLKARSGKLRKAVNVLRRSLKLSSLQKKLGTDISCSFGITANIANSLSFGAEKKIMSCRSFEEIKDKFYMKLIAGHSDEILCCSKKMADTVREMYRVNNVRAIWNPCDIRSIRKQSEAEPDTDICFFRTKDRVLLSMGREDDVKGFWHLLKIFKRINEEEANTRLAIIGAGEFSEYKKLAEDLNIKDRVLFTGLKANPFPYLKESSLYLLTSLSEGFPNALVEAMALSLPVVSANCFSGPAEILHRDYPCAEARKEVFQGDYGILTPVLSAEKKMQVQWQKDGKVCLEEEEENFAKAVIALLKDKELFDKYKEKAGERAGDFSLEQYLEEWISCMEQL